MEKVILNSPTATVKIKYTGDIDPKKDAFIVYFYGYDDLIGHSFKECNTSFKSNRDIELGKHVSKDTETKFDRVSYWNVDDVFNFYERCFKDINSCKERLVLLKSYTSSFNNMVKKFNFKIETKIQ
jgi:hypothetical protein